MRIEDGRVVALEGNHVNPVTGGFICAKVRRYPERVYGRDRLHTPLRRTGAKGEGHFEPFSWDEALETIASRLAEVRLLHGGEAILPFSYGGSNGLLSQGIADERLFRSLGASRLARTVCAAQTGAASQALYGKMASVDFPDFAQARFILIWGANPRHSNLHLMPYLQRARAAGAKVALVDPRRVLAPSEFDWHLPVRPGTDVVLALALMAHLERRDAVDRNFLQAHATGGARLLERAREWPPERAAEVVGVPAADIVAVAEAYAAAEPALVRCGWGVERNRNGEAAVAAILALPAVAGKFGRAGGGYALSSSEAYRFDGEGLIGVPEPLTRVVNMSQLGRVLLEAEPKVRALFVYDANPVVTLPDQNRVQEGLRRPDLFTVVFDQVLTDTARYADVVLPATTFLEAREMSTSYGTYSVLLGEPLIAPVGASRSNEDVFASLGVQLGVAPDPRADGDARLADVLAAFDRPLAGDAETSPSGADRLARLRGRGVLKPAFEHAGPVQFGDVFPNTADGRIHLWPEALGPEPYAFLPDGRTGASPLVLISPSSDRSICSTLGEVGFGEAALEMHPDDARARGLREGQEVRVHNGLGEVRVALRLSGLVRTGVVSLPKGLWARHTRNGSVASALVPDAVSAISGGALFNDTWVEVTACP